MSRRPIRLILAAVAALAIVGFSPAMASADAPTPESPYNGIANGIVGSPNPIPPHEDPFEPGSKTTIYEQYSTAGMTWATYDQGIAGPGDAFDDTITGVANLMMLAPVTALAATTSLANLALNPTSR